MKGGSSIISSIHHLKIAFDYLQDFSRERPESKGSKLFQGYAARLQWIATHLITHPALPEQVREGIKAEWQADPLTVVAIHEKIALLNPAMRESLEKLIDSLLKGETLTVEHY